MSELLAPRTPGAALRAAREKHKLSIADVVEATRIKTHIIEALEHDNYNVIAAPLYGKGFIKMYAEYVGLDPEPLVRHYLEYYARNVRPTLKTEMPPPAAINDGLPVPSPLARFKESGGSAVMNLSNSVITAMRDVMQSLVVAWARLQAARRDTAPSRPRLSSTRGDYSEPAPIPVGRVAAIGFAALVVLILVVTALYSFSGKKESASTASTSAMVREPARKTSSSQSLRLAEPPPAPYLKLK